MIRTISAFLLGRWSKLCSPKIAIQRTNIHYQYLLHFMLMIYKMVGWLVMRLLCLLDCCQRILYWYSLRTDVLQTLWKLDLISSHYLWTSSFVGRLLLEHWNKEYLSTLQMQTKQRLYRVSVRWFYIIDERNWPWVCDRSHWYHL